MHWIEQSYTSVVIQVEKDEWSFQKATVQLNISNMCWLDNVHEISQEFAYQYEWPLQGSNESWSVRVTACQEVSPILQTSL